MKSNFYRKVLKNGMTIILEKRNLPVVSIAFAVRNGGVNEKEEEKGISHFIEHLLYKGTPTRNPKKIADEIEKRGGELNGFTSEEITAYWCKIPSKHIKSALDVLSDMIKNPLFDEKEIEKERLVIFEEIKMYHDTPRLHVFDEIQKSLYDKTMSINLAGTFETMNSINREKIIKKFKQVYTPNNLILCVVGDADFNSLVDFAEKNFDNKKGNVPFNKFNMKNDSKIEFRSGIDQANLVFAYHSPLAGNDKSYASLVLNTLMAGGMSSRLFSEIREKRNLAYAVKGERSINKTFSYSLIYVGTMKENINKVKELILQEFEKVSTTLNEKELDEIKEQLIGNHYISMEDSQTQMVSLLIDEIHGNAKSFYDFEKKISGVTLNDVKKLASNVKNDYSFFALVPK
ncbi:MAG TPA: pitrilysin family protein [Candidatus Pacearchaeota archaeon]|nr:pitrilysin family protein [Candidatus Pacearchaeota archaeon]